MRLHKSGKLKAETRKKILPILFALGILCLGLTIDVWTLTEVTTPDSGNDVFAIVKSGGGAGRKIKIGNLVPKPADAGLTNEVNIAIRTDGLGGDGTKRNPFDGSTGAKFDALMADSTRVPTSACKIHLGPGRFKTNPVTRTWSVQSGWEISGAGMNVTTVQIDSATNLAGSRGVTIFGNPSGSGVNGVRIHDLTVDTNWSAVSSTADSGSGGEKNIGAGGIYLFGSGNHIYYVRSINTYGSGANGRELFAIGLASASNADSFGNTISFCRVENTLGNYGSPYAITGASGHLAYSARVFGCQAYGINNGLNGGFTTGGVNIAYVKDLTVEGNTFVDTFGPVYWDTGSLDGLYIRNNTVIRAFLGGVVLTQNAGTPRNVEIVGNTLHVQNRVVGGASYGISVQQCTTATNFKVESNTIYHETDGSGSTDFISIGAADNNMAANFRALNNITDASTTGPGGEYIKGSGLTILGNRGHDGSVIPELTDLAPLTPNVSTSAKGAARFQVTTTANNGFIHYQWSGSRTIVSGDKLQYEVMIDTSVSVGTSMVAELTTSGGSTLGTSFDQNGINTIGDIGGFAKDKWYLRQFDLTPSVGGAAALFRFGVLNTTYGGAQNPLGQYRYFLRNVRIIDASGNTKVSFYTDENQPVPVWSGDGTSFTGDSAIVNNGWGNSLGGIAFANLPSTPREGMMAPVTDSSTNTHGATITGGGANHVLAYRTNSNWVVAYP